MKQPKRTIREPLQIYMAGDERRLLDQLSDETGLSRAEILRQGLRQFAMQRAESSIPATVTTYSVVATYDDLVAHPPPRLSS